MVNPSKQDQRGIKRPMLRDFKPCNDSQHKLLPSDAFKKLRAKIKNKRRGKLTDSMIVLHDDVQPHVTHRVLDQLNVMQ